MRTLPALPLKPGWDSAVRIGDRAIPTYDALRDPNCVFTHTKKFRSNYVELLTMQQQELALQRRVVQGDFQRLSQVIHNFLSNARKFSGRRGGVQEGHKGTGHRVEGGVRADK